MAGLSGAALSVALLPVAAADAAPTAAPPPACTAEQAAGPAVPVQQPAQRSDFNGDGRADIARITTYGDEDPPDRSVTVLLTGADGQVSCQQQLPLESATSSQAIASADVNADGRDDLVQQIPGSRLRIFYGSQFGMAGPATQDVVSPLGPFFNFGWDVVSADFDRDGYPDLAVGAPRDHETANRSSANESIFIYRGGANGIHAKHPQRILTPNRKTPFFGQRLTVGEFTGNRYPDLIESYRGTHRSAIDTSRMLFMRGTADGLTSPVKIARTAGYTTSVGDVAGSSADDVVVANGTGLHLVVGHRHQPLGQRLLPGTAEYNAVGTLMDLDNDGHPEALLGTLSSGLQYLPGVPGGFDAAHPATVDVATSGPAGCEAATWRYSYGMEKRDLNGDTTTDLLGAAVTSATDPSCDGRWAFVDFLRGETGGFASSQPYYLFDDSETGNGYSIT